MNPDSLRRLGVRLRHGRRADDPSKVVELERRVEKLRAKVEKLQRQRVEQQWSAAYTDSPLVRLDYEGADITVVAAARHRTARAQTKEPFTVEWLERTFRSGDVLYDIGANVGAYSLIAAAIAPEGRIVAFEPGCVSFAVLCSNIAVNGLAHRVIPLPIPLGAHNELATLRYWSLAPGSGTIDGRVSVSEPSAPVFEQQVLVQRLDDLVRTFDLPLPTHVKLDVDGAEAAVLAGARETLASQQLRTLIVELAPNAEAELVLMLKQQGFRLAQRHAAREETGTRYATFARTSVGDPSIPARSSADASGRPF